MLAPRLTWLRTQFLIKFSMKKLTLALATCLLSAISIFAAELGDPAKPLDIKDWVKGGPVSLSEGKGKTIYVVEFWATWCPPCRTSIPHLTEVQKEFKDKGVVVIGVSDEKTDVVKKFVDKMGDKMDYVVAIDGGKTSEGYMEAYGARGIPHAFIVNKDGNIVWEGHPMDGLDKALEQIVEGKFDMSQAKKRATVAAKLSEYVELSLSGENPEKLAKLEAELVALEEELGNIMNGEKFDPADLKKRIAFGQKVMKYQQLIAAEAGESEIADLEKELEASAPKDFDFKAFKENIKKAMVQRKESMKIQGLFTRYAQAVGEDGDAEKAAELSKELAALKIESPEILNGIAWTILSSENIKERDTKLALDFAKRAVDATEGKEAGILDTYARALFETGDVAEAVTQQKKAIELTEDDEEKAELTATLKKYEGKSN